MRTFGNLSFYIPFAYTWHSRIRNVRTFIGWAGKYIIPLVILGIFLSNFSWILFSLGLIYTFCLYEMGYIENDCETIKTEYNPTLRLSIDELKFYELHKWSIYVIRLFIAIILAYIMLNLGAPLWSIGYAFLLLPLYYFYNRKRNSINLHLYLIQVFMRYSIPMFIAVAEVNIPLVIFTLTINALPSYLYRLVLGKFGYVNHFIKKYIVCGGKEALHPFRLRYYTVLFIIVIIAYFFVTEWIIFPYIGVYLYLWIFTINGYINIYKKQSNGRTSN